MFVGYWGIGFHALCKLKPLFFPDQIYENMMFQLQYFLFKVTPVHAFVLIYLIRTQQWAFLGQIDCIVTENEKCNKGLLLTDNKCRFLFL